MISARVGRKKISTDQPEVQQAQPVDDPPWLTAVRAAESKKATDVRVLDLREVTSFADYFVICTGANARRPCCHPSAARTAAAQNRLRQKVISNPPAESSRRTKTPAMLQHTAQKQSSATARRWSDRWMVIGG